jgi:hypothetical protein
MRPGSARAREVEKSRSGSGCVGLLVVDYATGLEATLAWRQSEYLEPAG